MLHRFTQQINMVLLIFGLEKMQYTYTIYFGISVLGMRRKRVWGGAAL